MRGPASSGPWSIKELLPRQFEGQAAAHFHQPTGVRERPVTGDDFCAATGKFWPVAALWRSTADSCGSASGFDPLLTLANGSYRDTR
jgi:hypothetical protein